MNKKPLVSIIIPVYNGEDYVKEAIDSALNQTYDNKEIIVINDGSKDKTEEICKKYGNKIRYYKKENGGVSTALNLAIEKMKGEYFSWLSHDDLYDKQKLEKEISELEKNTILLSDYNLIDEKGKVIRDIILPHEIIEKNYENALYKGFINGITLLIPKQAFIECGNFDENLKCTQDYDMWLKMLLKGYKFKHIPEVLASSRQHSNQTTNTSPRVITEGNELWINMIEKLPQKTKEKMSGSEYNFYRELKKVLTESPYKEALVYVENKKNEIEEKQKMELSKIKVSVIMPIYDESKEVLIRSINSVLSQTHNNIEYLIINDNPAKYKKDFINSISKDKRITYIENKKNIGVSASRNNGLKKSTGDYIVFLDADDEFLPNKIERQLKEMVLTNQHFSHTSYIRVNSCEEIIASGLLDGNVYRQCIYSCGIATPTVMIKKDFLDENQLYFNEEIHIGEDTCYWLEILKLTSIIGINEPLTKVHVDINSAAYNNNKQITGLKNILTYVLNDQTLNKCDKEIAKLSRDYSNLVLAADLENNYDYYQVVNSLSWKITAPLRLISKTLRSLKKDGIKMTFKKIKRKLKRSK